MKRRSRSSTKCLGIGFFVSVSIRNYIVLVCLTASFVIAGCAGEMRRGLPMDRQRMAKEIPRNVLFIHAWLTAKSWDNFSSFSKQKATMSPLPHGRARKSRSKSKIKIPLPCSRPSESENCRTLHPERKRTADPYRPLAGRTHRPDPARPRIGLGRRRHCLKSARGSLFQLSIYNTEPAPTTPDRKSMHEAVSEVGERPSDNLSPRALLEDDRGLNVVGYASAIRPTVSTGKMSSE